MTTKPPTKPGDVLSGKEHNHTLTKLCTAARVEHLPDTDDAWNTLAAHDLELRRQLAEAEARAERVPPNWLTVKWENLEKRAVALAAERDEAVRARDAAEASRDSHKLASDQATRLAVESVKLRAKLDRAVEALRPFIPPHCGLCCRDDGRGNIVTPPDACVCSASAKAARAILVEHDKDESTPTPKSESEAEALDVYNMHRRRCDAVNAARDRCYLDHGHKCGHVFCFDESTKQGAEAQYARRGELGPTAREDVAPKAGSVLVEQSKPEAPKATAVVWCPDCGQIEHHCCRPADSGPTRDELVAALRKMKDMAGGRWCEWGERAESVSEILDDILTRLDKEAGR
jgi:hypothetical protein